MSLLCSETLDKLPGLCKPWFPSCKILGCCGAKRASNLRSKPQWTPVPLQYHIPWATKGLEHEAKTQAEKLQGQGEWLWPSRRLRDSQVLWFQYCCCDKIPWAKQPKGRWGWYHNTHGHNPSFGGHEAGSQAASYTTLQSRTEGNKSLMPPAFSFSSLQSYMV